MTDTPLRFGLIGTGRIGQVHAANIAADPEATLAWVCDPFVDGANAVAARYGGTVTTDAAEMLESTGQTESGLNQLATIGFDTLGLQTYLTAGPKETRAWTIGKGWTAPQAAGVIHTDFQKGFIKAEIISFDDLVETGSIAEARAKGKARIEGKDYVMQDGDVVEFRFNN